MRHETEYPAPHFVSPTARGYVYAGYSIDAPAHAPFVRRSPRRMQAVDTLGELQDQLRDLPEVASTTLFQAVLMPPIPGSPRHDLLMLVQTADVAHTRAVSEQIQGTGPPPSMLLHAVNTHRIGDTEADMSGTFLFNHFSGPDAGTATSTWKAVTGWYTSKTGVDNSTLLEVEGESPFAIVNYVRLPGGAPGFLANQLGRPSFHRFVRPRLKDNDVRPMPLFYRAIKHTTGGPGRTQR
ncbi:hypothetical protein [Phytoactinopolyspora halotolerans]|uniref:Uncharacterized protein n=1 Tax=Phytoactinopolyspora halotolerans TaxID=1981512 RepID=A0A6L9S6G8_9ACTN|nr:hypothetical protein [Phytoactinopolyspora halotolerans]NEE00128.1 hypothetical protein [Phytoactinopolyspora halotolerans]